MAERSVFWTTDGTGHGTSGGYPQDRIYDWLRKMFQPGQEAVAGPLWGEGDYLSISGSSLPLTVQEGCALGYGAFYENTADFSVSGTFTPSIGTTGGRINLVLDYSAQTAKIQANQSADGVATLPSLTQSAGVTWEVPLYTYTVTTGGVVTLTDVRAYPYFATKVKTLMIDDGAITLAKMAANSVDSDQYVDGSIDTAHIAADAVDWTLVGNRVPFVYQRVGGSATDWNTAGSGTYNPTTTVEVVGTVKWAGSAAANASLTIAFPTAFAAKPVVFIEPEATGLISTSKIDHYVSVPDNTQFIITWVDAGGATHTSLNFFFRAIGQMAV